MKTQISQLRSGTKNQILNQEVDYSTLPIATSHVGHSGSNQNECSKIWEDIKAENPETMTIVVFDQTLSLIANWSLSRKSVSYVCNLTAAQIEMFGIQPSAKKQPYLSIQNANTIIAHNGQNSYTHVCPSLINII